MPEKKYNHKEAYCLMLYECEQCKEIETLWNSRDGVTPFIIGCKKCGGAMQHEHWEKDECKPDYLPRDGQRVFIDITPEINDLYIRVRVGLYWNNPEYPHMKEHYPDKMGAVKAMSSSGKSKGQPYVITI